MITHGLSCPQQLLPFKAWVVFSQCGLRLGFCWLLGARAAPLGHLLQLLGEFLQMFF